jgi:hypothetical protein
VSVFRAYLHWQNHSLLSLQEPQLRAENAALSALKYPSSDIAPESGSGQAYFTIDTIVPRNRGEKKIWKQCYANFWVRAYPKIMELWVGL